MAEDPVIGLLEGGPPGLVDSRLDVARFGHCKVVKTAIPALSFLVLGLRTLDFGLLSGGLYADVPPTY
jgi:hypothetical protein